MKQMEPPHKGEEKFLVRLLMSKDKAPVEKEMKEKTKDFQQDKLEYINTSSTYHMRKTSEER